MRKPKHSYKDVEEAFDRWLKRAATRHKFHIYTTTALMSYAWEGAIRYMTRKYGIKARD